MTAAPLALDAGEEVLQRGAPSRRPGPTTTVVMPWLTAASASGCSKMSAVGVAVGVDETRRQNQAAGVDDRFAGQSLQLTDGSRSDPLDTHVSREARLPGPIHHGRAGDQGRRLTAAAADKNNTQNRGEQEDRRHASSLVAMRTLPIFPESSARLKTRG